MAEFELRIETDTDQQLARLKLFGVDGGHLGSNDIRLPEHSSALREGLFDTRRYVERYEGAMIFEDQTQPATARKLLERLGLLLGEKVLGEGIVRALAGPGRAQQPHHRRIAGGDDHRSGWVHPPDLLPLRLSFRSAAAGQGLAVVAGGPGAG